ncbi:Homocysteine S-methyltransferase 2 [Capsicum annuum]|uniref:Homocysteine S-methyltransferase 2 n=1 Tax=Capsicum annuum TaxID=4072 RepID=A0A2G2YS16_CAPAN|nr:Homocysteine S-methyltransferase 2 [Capsicum annuum]
MTTGNVASGATWWNCIAILDGTWKLGATQYNRIALLEIDNCGLGPWRDTPISWSNIVHLDYLEAGADIILSSSYQATIQGFKAKGYSVEESESLLKRSVEIACEARDVYYNRCRESSSDHSTDGKILKQRPILVAASVGSYGAYLADGSEYRNLTPCLDGGFPWYGMVNKGTMFVLIVF